MSDLVTILRFRDLMRPKGETIRKHRAIIQEHGYVWWGWVKREDEIEPLDLLDVLQDEIIQAGFAPALLYHSGVGGFYPAKISQLSAFPGGYGTSTPSVQHTPVYMHEAPCPIWFQMNEISDVCIELELSDVLYEALPTLKPDAVAPNEQPGQPVNNIRSLHRSAATLLRVRVSTSW